MRDVIGGLDTDQMRLIGMIGMVNQGELTFVFIAHEKDMHMGDTRHGGWDA